MGMNSPRMARALISVSDKLGLVDFAQGLAAAGIEIYSTGGTRRHLESAGLKVVDLSAYTGFPEMMDGRLKTLHPKVFGGILCRHDRADDRDSLAAHGILPFELVVVNLYPFEETIARGGATWSEAIEQIDIGGPSLVRAAAKNHAFVTVATRAEQYASILGEVAKAGCTTLSLRKKLAAEAFAHTAAYERVIADYFARHAHGEQDSAGFPSRFELVGHLKDVLRHGENPHQLGALYAMASGSGANLVSARQLAGKKLSYNNLLDLDSALAIVRGLPLAAAVVIKHNNPCGAASAESLSLAVERALEGDPLSAFGSVLAFNRPVDTPTADVLARPGLFIEAIVAPSFEAKALEILTTRPKWKENVRLLSVGQIGPSAPSRHARQIDGGLLVQDADVSPDLPGEWRVATRAHPTDEQFAELAFAWQIVRHVKSNAIVLSRERSVCGVGAGQMSRVDSVDIAVAKAGPRAAGSVMASDAFFPFPDSIEKAAAAGVAAVIQPGGSKKDSDVIEACDRHGIGMVLTGRRHFKH
jgi:phosphoribosylaminoimidazolecarboxamide formyltransferase/IMP cyclohydrolase